MKEGDRLVSTSPFFGATYFLPTPLARGAAHRANQHILFLPALSTWRAKTSEKAPKKQLQFLSTPQYGDDKGMRDEMVVSVYGLLRAYIIDYIFPKCQDQFV